MSKMSPEQFIASVGLIYAAVTGPFWIASTFDAPERPAAQQITEDSEGWDCRTMGNKICGVMQDPYEPGRYEIVGGEPHLVERWNQGMIGRV